ncbi:MAG: HD-GYP domain-containing protein [Candidatus Omnitrophica bacterium]|nr:HD-GYP domain-containing protein [Candidatus Omnitrophota bacterium]
MKIDYKKELETASKGMIMIHEPKLLIKLIVRMIVRKLRVKHAAMILFEPRRNAYVLNISRGELGVKVPAGFTRFTGESPIIRVFNRREFRPLTFNPNAILSEDINRLIWHESIISNGNGNGKLTKELLCKVDEQMQMLNAVACVPAYYRHKLMAILLLGEKHDGSRFEQEELDFFAALASDAAMAIRNAQLFEDLKREADRNRALFLQTIEVLGSTIEAKDAYTHGHTGRVTEYSVALARQMAANGSAHFPEVFFENLYIAGLLHDIGKIAIPESILNKQGKLTDAEYEIMKQHTVRGVEMVAPLSLPKESLEGIRNHHERFDGRGYPDGFKGEAVPMSAAIMAVADTFDAMTSDRPYRKGLSKEAAMEEIRRCCGTQFNPVVVKAMLELYEHGKM